MLVGGRTAIGRMNKQQKRDETPHACDCGLKGRDCGL